MSTIGIDLGNRGAIARLDLDCGLVDVVEMPTLNEGPMMRPRLNAPLLARLLEDIHPRPDIAYIELVTSRPTDGHQSAFAFGLARGVVEGVLGALAIRFEWLSVPEWRKLLDMPRNASKDDARAFASRRWPGQAQFFAKPADHDKAEASLVGLAGIRRENRRNGAAA